MTKGQRFEFIKFPELGGLAGHDEHGVFGAHAILSGTVDARFVGYGHAG